MRILIGVAVGNLTLLCHGAAASESRKTLEDARAEFARSRCVYSEYNPNPTLMPCSSDGPVSYFFYRTMNNALKEGKVCLAQSLTGTHITTDSAFKDPREQLRFLGYMHSFWMARKDDTRARMLTETAATKILRSWNQEVAADTGAISTEAKNLWAKQLKGEEREKVGRLIEVCMPHKIDDLPYEVLSLMPSIEVKPSGNQRIEEGKR